MPFLSETIKAPVAAIETAITDSNEPLLVAQEIPPEPSMPPSYEMSEPKTTAYLDDKSEQNSHAKAFGRQQMLVIGLAICFLIGGIWVVSSRSTSAENGSAASSDQFVAANYKDQFLSDGAESVSVLSTARMRDYPSTKGTNVVATHQPEETLKGRWVKGVDPSTRWLRVTLDGTKVGYVWEGNLQSGQATNATFANLDWQQLKALVSREQLEPDKQINIRQFDVLKLIITAAANKNVYNDMLNLNQGQDSSFDLQVFENKEVLIFHSIEPHNAVLHNASILINWKKKVAVVCLRKNGVSDWYVFGNRIHRSSSDFNDCPWDMEGIPPEINSYRPPQKDAL